MNTVKEVNTFAARIIISIVMLSLIFGCVSLAPAREDGIERYFASSIYEQIIGWSADGTLMYFQNPQDRKGLNILEIPTGQVRYSRKLPRPQPYHPRTLKPISVVSPDEKWVAHLTAVPPHFGGLVVQSLVDNREWVRTSTHANAVVFSPDSKSVIYRTSDGSIYIDRAAGPTGAEPARQLDPSSEEAMWLNQFRRPTIKGHTIVGIWNEAGEKLGETYPERWRIKGLPSECKVEVPRTCLAYQIDGTGRFVVGQCCGRGVLIDVTSSQGQTIELGAD